MAGKIATYILVSFLFIGNAFADKLEVEAEDSLEWHRAEKLYIAKGDAKATQGGQSILADEIYAYYNETEEDGIDIWKIEAKSNVLISDGGSKIMGDEAIYDVANQEFSVIGDNLDILSEGYQIKANKNIKYFEAKNEIIAIGSVIVYQDSNEMRCDKLAINLVDTATGEKEVSEIFAIGSVEIITPTDKITGEEGYYNTKKEFAEVTGEEVVISRDNSVITGGKATVNMKTGVAKMLSNGNKKVRAVFVREENK